MGIHFKLMLYIKTFSIFYLAIYLCIIGAILFIGLVFIRLKNNLTF